MTSQPQVSIVMPAYNAAATIEKSIQSVVAQTFSDWELLILDDGSVDHTVEIAEKWALSDERIHLHLNKENMGVGATRKKGIELAKAPLIAFLDSDDCWLPEKLEKQVPMLEDADCALCFTGSAFVLEDGRASGHVLRVPQRVSYGELLKQNVISCSSVLIRKETIAAFPMPDNPMLHEDYAAWLAVLSLYPYALGIDEPLLVYRVSSKSKSGDKLKAAKMQWNTYRHCGVPVLRACSSFLFYAVRNLRKYAAIFK